MTIAFGTDAAVYPHGENGRQFILMKDWRGMTPMQAIRSATSIAATLMGWQDRVGALAPGRYADLVAVRGDPLDDLRLLEAVPFVVKGGRWSGTSGPRPAGGHLTRGPPDRRIVRLFLRMEAPGMKKTVSVLALLALAAMPVAFACDKPKAAAAEFGKGPIQEVVLTGYLTDSSCGAANASAAGKDCALRCIKGGAQVQLVAGKKVYTIEKLDNVESHLGHEVKVAGQLDTETNVIRIASIEKAAQS